VSEVSQKKRILEKNQVDENLEREKRNKNGRSLMSLQRTVFEERVNSKRILKDCY